ncbi:MAG: hypothetical protein ACF8XB_25085 [Planctomycetota bacterium JB042]
MRPAPRALAAAAIVLAAASPAAALPALLATDGHFLYSIDTQTFSVTPVGPMALIGTSTETYHASLATDPSGQLWSMSNKALYRVDQATGRTTPVGGLNVGTVVEGGLAFHPATGEAYGSNHAGGAIAGLMRLDTDTGWATPLGAFPGGVPHDFNGLAFDASGQLYGIDGWTNSLWTIDHQNPGGPGTTPVGAPFGATVHVGYFGGMAYDPGTSRLWAYGFASHALFTIDPATGVATVQTVLPGTVPPLFGLTFGDCTSTVSYGTGCAGSGGFTPKLDLLPCPALTGQTVQLAIEEALGGAPALLAFGFGPGALPMDGDCDLLVQPLLPQVLSFPLGGAGAGNGGVVLSASIPPSLPTPVTFTLQAFVADPGGTASFSNSAGLEVTIEQ